jgi:hypothetical protein
MAVLDPEKELAVVFVVAVDLVLGQDTGDIGCNPK